MIRTVVGFILSLLLLRRTYKVRQLRKLPTQEMMIAAAPPIMRLLGESIISKRKSPKLINSISDYSV